MMREEIENGERGQKVMKGGGKCEEWKMVRGSEG